MRFPANEYELPAARSLSVEIECAIFLTSRCRLLGLICRVIFILLSGMFIVTWEVDELLQKKKKQV